MSALDLIDSLEDPEMRAAFGVVAKQLRAPLADTWGCSHQGHLVSMIERLGAVSTEVQNVTEAARSSSRAAEHGYRRDLVEQLAELGANVIVMLTEELKRLREVER